MKFLNVLAALAFFVGITNSAVAQDSRLFEMRIYYAAEGKLDDLHARFRDHTLKLFEKHGMENVGYCVPVKNDESKLIYVLAYPNREARDKSWKAFMNDPEWKRAYAASTKNGRLVKKVDAKFMKATDYSPMIGTTADTDAEHFELRIYYTNDGKLKNLDARFRDHTMEIFADLGMQNLAYWHLTDDQEGADSTMIYVLGYENSDARKKAWQGFGQDPRWKKAYAESTKDGKLVKKVDSIQMKLTDYSP